MTPSATIVRSATPPSRLGLGVLLAGVLTASAGAQAVDAPAVTYPSANDRPTIAAWLAKETDVRAETVVALTPEAAVSILQSRPMGGVVAVVVRGEVLTPEAFERDKVLSWHATVQVDCKARRVRQGVTTGYAARNLLFDSRAIRAADTDWSTPAPGEPLDQVRRATCEAGFQPPLTASETATVVPEPSRPAPATPPPTAPKAPPRPAPVAVAKPPPPPPPAPAKPQVQAKPKGPMAPVSAQIAALASQAEAARLLERMKARFAEPMAGLETRIVKAVVDGKTYHRALVVGFSDRASAAAFCAAVKVAGQACFVRGDLG